MLPDDPRHGTTRGFHAGCREACCRAAITRYEKAGRLARLHGGLAVPSIGAQRRIQALMTMGWTSSDIADAAGWRHRNYVRRIMVGQNGRPCRWLERKTHNAIVAVYERLSMRFPEPAPHRARTRTLALRNGWAPPLAWDDIDTDESPDTGGIDIEIDEVLVRRILDGDWRLPCTPAEKTAVIERWTGTRNELARLTHWKIERYSVLEGVA